jgi:hypothetical protein
VNWIDLLWFAQAPGGKLFLLGLCAVVIISVMRFSRLARRLSRTSGEGISTGNIVQGEADPDLLATSALAGRVPSESVPGEFANFGSTERPGAEVALHILRVAETKFLYLWEGCHADVESTKRSEPLHLLAVFRDGDARRVYEFS